MDTFEVMKKYFISEQAANKFIHKLEVVSRMRNELLLLGLVPIDLNINSFYRILSRCVREVSEQLSSAHLDLRILIKGEEDICFWGRDPFERESGNWPIEIDFDWMLMLRGLFEEKSLRPEMKIENLIQELIEKSPFLSISLVDESRISFADFRDYLKSLIIPGRTVNGRKNKLLHIVQSGHAGLFASIEVARRDSDISEGFQDIQDFRRRYCNGAPLNLEGLITVPEFESYEYPKLKMPRRLGLEGQLDFGKDWLRKSKALIVFLDYGFKAGRLVNSWGMHNAMSLFFEGSVHATNSKFVEDEVHRIISLFENWVTDDRSSIQYYLGKSEIDTKVVAYYRKSLHQHKACCHLVKSNKDFAGAYFSHATQEIAPSDWFDD